MTSQTEITMTLLQLIGLMGAIISGVFSTAAVYWRLNSKITRNEKEIKDIEQAIRYDIENRFAILFVERKGCNEAQTNRINKIEDMLIQGNKINMEKHEAALAFQEKMLDTLDKMNMNITLLNTKFEKHETYHETIDKIRK